MRLLEADLARDWTLTGLAAELHLAPGYLVRLFNAATGLPPMAYLGQLRAEHAAVLLLHSDEPVTSIGRAVGGLTRAALPGASKPTTASAPPPTASASPPALPTFTFPPGSPPDQSLAHPGRLPALTGGLGAAGSSQAAQIASPEL